MRTVTKELEEASQAFGALAEEHWGRAFAVALGVLRNVHEAEEAVQDALLRALVHLPSLRNPRRFGPWLARIVQNEARQRLRRRRTPAEGGNALSRVAAPEPAEPDPPWTGRQLAAALETLTYNQRVVVALRYLVGLTPAEIAGFLGLSRVSVRKRLHDGLRRLRGHRIGRPPRSAARSRMPIDRREDMMNRIPKVLSRILEGSAAEGEERTSQVVVLNLMDRLLEDRIVFLSGRIGQEQATSVTSQFLFLQRENREAPVHVYILSPGGDLFAGLAIYDTMQFLACPVHTYAIGQASGVAALVLAGGETGCRFLLPNAAVMLHQPSVGESEGLQEHFQEAAAARFRGRLVQLLSAHTKADENRIDRDLTRGVYLTAEEAREYGLADEIV